MAGIRCAQCGAEIAPGMSFCTNCGTPVAAPQTAASNVCPHCGTANVAGTLFCVQCGKPIDDAAFDTRQPVATQQTQQTQPAATGPIYVQPAPALTDQVPAWAPTPAPTYDQEPPRRTSPLPYILTCVAVAAVVAGVGIFALRDHIFATEGTAETQQTIVSGDGTAGSTGQGESGSTQGSDGSGSQGQSSGGGASSPSSGSSDSSYDAPGSVSVDDVISKRGSDDEEEERKAKEAEEAEEAARKAQEEADAAARKKAEEEARKAQEGSTVSISVTGADGTVRSGTIHRQGTSERVFPDSNTRYLSASEVAALSDAERCIAWNEIIAASNGYCFMNSSLANYFNSCSWYYPNPSADGGGVLTDAGAANVSLLKSYTDGWWLDLARY